MKIPAITAIYAGLLMLLYVALSFNVIRQRQGNRISLGDGGNADLRVAIRSHGHFGEYVPFILLLIAILEGGGVSTGMVHALLVTLLIARVLHPVGMAAKPGTPQFTIGRVGGMVLTLTVMIASALIALWRFALT